MLDGFADTQRIPAFTLRDHVKRLFQVNGDGLVFLPFNLQGLFRSAILLRWHGTEPLHFVST